MNIDDYIPKISELSDIASIVGLIISLYLLFGIRKLKKQFDKFILFRARVPELRNDLENIASKIIKLMNEYPDSSRDILSELSNCNAILKNLRHKISGEYRKSTNHLLSLIQNELNYKSSALIPKFLNAIQGGDKEEHQTPLDERIYILHRKLESLILEIKNLEEDQKWSFKND